MRLPDEKLTEFALRLVLTGHTAIPRENEIDFLKQAECVFATSTPEEKAVAGKPKAKKHSSTKKKLAA